MKARFGRRGAFLSLFAVIYGLIGYSFLVAKVVPQTAKALHFATDVMPLQAWGVTWLAGAAVMLACSVLRTGRDWLGFMAGWMLPASWALLFLLAWLNNDLPRGWVSAALYAALAAAVGVVASWPEPGAR